MPQLRSKGPVGLQLPSLCLATLVSGPLRLQLGTQALTQHPVTALPLVTLLPSHPDYLFS